MPQANYLGTVTAIEVQSGLITIQSDAYRWTFGGGEWISCDDSLMAEAPNSDAMQGVHLGDRVEVSELGEPGLIRDRWVSLARLKPGTGEIITDAYGDPAYLFSPLEGFYSLDYTNAPDCGTCIGCWCKTTHASVALAIDLGLLDELDLNPGEEHHHQSDPYCIYVIFYSGEADGYPICTEEPCGGPQFISDFTVHVIDCENHGWAAGAVSSTLHGGSAAASAVSNVLTLLVLASGTVFLLKAFHRRSEQAGRQADPDASQCRCSPPD